MKRILYIFPTLNPGGAEKAAILVANFLVERYSYDVTFFVYDHSTYYRSLIDKRIRVLQQHQRLTFGSKPLWWYYYYVDFGRRLSRSIKGDSYDYIVSIHEQVPEVAAAWVWLAQIVRGVNIRPKLVTVIQSSLSAGQRRTRGLASRSLGFVLRHARRHVFGTIVVLSNALRREVLGYHGNIAVIPNPIDSDGIQRRIEEPISSAMSAVFQKPYIVCVARIAEQKNPMMLLRAFQRVHSKVDFSLIMIGHIFDLRLHKAMMRYILEQGLQSRISILGMVDNPYHYMAGAKAVVLSSDYEGLPLSLLEAMALKVPIIATRYSGHEEYFDDRNATLVNRNSDEELARALLDVQQGSDHFRKRAEKAFSDSAKFHIGAIGAMYHTLFLGAQ